MEHKVRDYLLLPSKMTSTPLTTLILSSLVVFTAFAFFRRGLLFPSTASRMFKSQRPSLTAELVCVYRAMGTLLDYYSDPFAWEFCDFDATLYVLFVVFARKWFNMNHRGIAMMTVRTRGFDQFIDNSGCTQVVILGAGLDSRAYRLKNLPANARFFEVDAPATQDMKRSKIEEVYRRAPTLFQNKAYVENRVVYVKCNFVNESFLDKLIENGFDKTNPKTVILLEGVASYLEWEDLKGTLLKVASCAPGTLFAMNVPQNRHQIMHSHSAKFLKYVVGEPWKFSMTDEDTAESLFAPLGFKILESYSFPEAFEKFVPDHPLNIEEVRQGPRMIFMQVL